MRSLLTSAIVLGAMAGGAPAGYTAIPDRPSADVSQLVYTPAGANWDVTSGKVAHILFAAKDSASGSYAVQATMQMLEKTAHREAFGLFIGGKDLADPAQRTYTYFVVAETGEYTVKVMKGSQSTVLTDWTKSADIPAIGADGKATYALKVHIAPNAMHFFVNGRMVAEVPKTGAPTDGIAGLRINHNLHLMVTPLTVTK